MAKEQQSVARILYKQIVEGDLRKLEARSNDADTGGGARDFRFGSYNSLLPVIRQMFPQTVKEYRKRGSVNVLIDVFKGVFHWRNAQGSVQTKEAYFEPPTDVRPSEGRIARVHEYPCLDPSRIQIDDNNRVLILLVQLYNGSVWPYYVEEKSLLTPKLWHPDVADAILSCMRASRPLNRIVIGYKDFASGSSYCNGK